MPVSITLWLGWTQARDLMAAELLRRGLTSARMYVDTAPTRSLAELVRLLGIKGVHDGHLYLSLWMEAAAIGTAEQCARDLLARDLIRYLKGGWSACPDSAKASIFYMWEQALPTNYHAAACSIYRAMKSGNIPEEWIPDDATDLILVEIFGTYWPIQTKATGRLKLDDRGRITIEYSNEAGCHFDDGNSVAHDRQVEVHLFNSQGDS